MTTTVSTKYQIVIPKVVRRQLGIKPGQKMQVEATKSGTILVKQSTEPIGIEGLSRHAGIIKTADTKWGQQKLDPAVWLRKQRDNNWD